MPDIALLKEFTEKYTVSYARERTQESMVGPGMFPEVERNELSFEYWKSQHRYPILANVQTFNAEAQIATREGGTKIEGQIPPIKRKVNLNERSLLALRREGAGDVDLVRDELYADMDNMIDSVQGRIEKMRMDAIAYGAITLAENNMQLSVDYGVPATSQETLTGDALWSDTANATPIDDIMRWVQDVIDECGVRPTRVLTSDTVMTWLQKNVNVRELIYGDAGGSRAVSKTQVNELMSAFGLPQIGLYNRQARIQAEDGTLTTIRFFPETRFVLLPPNDLGETLFGPTAEALLSNEVNSREVGGMYCKVYEEDEPPMVWTKAAATSIPTFPAAEEVFIATVLSE